jgi:hypothetical protein
MKLLKRIVSLYATAEAFALTYVSTTVQVNAPFFACFVVSTNFTDYSATTEGRSAEVIANNGVISVATKFIFPSSAIVHSEFIGLYFVDTEAKTQSFAIYAIKVEFVTINSEVFAIVVSVDEFTVNINAIAICTTRDNLTDLSILYTFPTLLLIHYYLA